MDDVVRRALGRGHLIDITTTGRRSKQPRRIEIVFHNIDGRIFISGRPDPRRTRDGLYHAQALTAGARRVQIIGLDLRWFRSPWQPTDERGAAGKERYLPDADPAKTMLGEAQWRWLDAQLRAPADVRLLISSIQCVVEGHGWER